MKKRTGYVYALSNKAMPGLIKIGRSINGGKKRAVDIDGTGIPTPFKLEFELYTEDCIYLESYVHERLSANRVNNNREFFKVEVFEAIEAITGCFVEDYDLQVANPDEIIDMSLMWEYCKKLGIENPQYHDALTMFNAITYELDEQSLKNAYEKRLKAISEKNKGLKLRAIKNG